MQTCNIYLKLLGWLVVRDLALMLYYMSLRFLLPCYHMKKRVNCVVISFPITFPRLFLILGLFYIHEHAGAFKF